MLIEINANLFFTQNLNGETLYSLIIKKQIFQIKKVK